MLEEVEEKTIRQYLLGELGEAGMAQFEERMMADEELFERLLVIEEDLIDEYTDDDLTAAERAHADAHFLQTPHRRERANFAHILREYANRPAEARPLVVRPSGDTVSPINRAGLSATAGGQSVEKPTPGPKRWWSAYPYLALATAAVILLAVGVEVLWTPSYKSDASKGRQALNQAYRAQRLIEARVTGLNYAPPPPSTRGNEPEKFDYAARDRAKSLFQGALRDHPDPQTYHEMGRFYLAGRDFDQAIIQLNKALELDANDAQSESDLGAAYLEKGLAASGDKSAEYFEESLTHLTRAIELKDSPLAARFNRALLYGHMNRKPEGLNEWRSYLDMDKDPDSPWAKEASRLLNKLEK